MSKLLQFKILQSVRTIEIEKCQSFDSKNKTLSNENNNMPIMSDVSIENHTHTFETLGSSNFVTNKEIYVRNIFMGTVMVLKKLLKMSDSLIDNASKNIEIIHSFVNI